MIKPDRISGATECFTRHLPAHIEQIDACAWLNTDKIAYTGPDHLDCLYVASRYNREAKRAVQLSTTGGDYHEYLRRNGWIDGFVTTKGNFVDRHAGIQIAKSQRQLQKEPATYHDNCADGLDSSDLILSTH